MTIQECLEKTDTSIDLCQGRAFDSLYFTASPLQELWLISVHLVFVVVLGCLYFLVEVPLLLFLALLVLAALSFVSSWCAYRRRCGCSVSYRSGVWSWRDRLGRRNSLLLPSALLWPGLVILYFRPADRWPRVVAILPDGADSDELRRLRVLLLHEPAALANNAGGQS